MVWQVKWCGAWNRVVECGAAGEVWRGTVGLGVERSGKVWLVWYGAVESGLERSSKVWQVSWGRVRLIRVSLGVVEQGR